MKELSKEDIKKINGGTSSFEDVKRVIDSADEQGLIAIFKMQHPLDLDNPLTIYLLQVLKNKYNIEYIDGNLVKDGVIIL